MTSLHGLFIESRSGCGDVERSSVRDRIYWVLTGAGDRFRTDDLVLGKHKVELLTYTPSFIGLVRSLYRN
jgi:hypothetical protein